MRLVQLDYDRKKAVAYAHRWAYFRNPDFYDFSDIGGDCTNYVSQCIFAGAGVMNYTPTYGWYYIGIDDRAPAWTGVKYLYNFLVNNKGPGPFGREVKIRDVQPGDVVQLIMDEDDFQHTPFVVSIEGARANFETVYVAAHSYDCDCRPLSSYQISGARFIHIDGVRAIAPDEGGPAKETAPPEAKPENAGDPPLQPPPDML